MTPPSPQTLADLRQAIDAVDDQVLSLLNLQCAVCVL